MHAMQEYEVVEALLHSFVTYALDVSGHHLAQATLPPEEAPLVPVDLL